MSNIQWAAVPVTPHADDELLIFTVAQLSKTFPQAHHGRCRPPAFRQHSNPIGMSTLRSTHATGERPSAPQNKDHEQGS